MYKIISLYKIYLIQDNYNLVIQVFNLKKVAG